MILSLASFVVTSAMIIVLRDRVDDLHDRNIGRVEIFHDRDGQV